MAAVASLSVLLVGLMEGLQLHDVALVILLTVSIGVVLDWMLLRPLRRLVTHAATVDPALPPSAGAREHQPVAELQQISESLDRVQQRLWQLLLDERHRSEELTQEIAHQQRALRQMQQALDGKTRELSGMSRIDDFTGLANRREFDAALQREFKQAQRQRGLLALAVLDLDQFRAYNEHYGEPAGDTALARFGQLLSIRFKRDTDLVARLDGAKFAALLPGFNIGAAQDLLEQVRSDLLALEIPNEDTGAPSSAGPRALTVSIGLSCYSPLHPYLSGHTLMQAADEALYVAKHAGRDRISLAASGNTIG